MTEQDRVAQERVAFLREQHRQVCFEQGDHPDEVDTAYSAGADAIERVAAMDKDAAMDRLVAEGQRCEAVTPQEAAKVLLADIISGRDDYARLLKDQPCGGFIGLRASLRAISEDSQ